MKNKPTTKVIGVGFQKTGTSSLRDALEVLGYNVGDNNYKLLFAILRGNYRKVIKHFNRYDAVEDNPWPLIYKELDKLVPGCKFILTIREEESWYKSVSRHIGDVRDPMHEWIYGNGKGLPKEDKENTLNVYKKHNREVINYFKDRPDDLLVIDMKEDNKWEKICGFLGHDIPAISYPHRNDSKKEQRRESILRKLKVLKKRVKYWMQIRFYRLFGYL